MSRTSPRARPEGRRPSPRPEVGPFLVKDCALLSIATGLRAQNLRELRDLIRQVPPASLYYHFWGRQLRPDFDDPEFNNDFASWARHGLHDHPLAERLALIDPTDFSDLEALRRELLEVIEQRLDESEWVPWSQSDRQFHFLRSQIVVFDTPHRVKTPRDLAALFPSLPLTSVFYHVIDARRRPPQGSDDIRAWLQGLGEEHRGLVVALGFLDPFFLTLAQLREAIAALLVEHLGSGEAAHA